MTDEELADELRATFTNATGPTTTDDWCKVARRARALLTTPATPELLEVVKRGRQKLATYVSVYTGDKELRQLLVDWDAAIAKAEGQNGIPPASPLPPICGMTIVEIFNEFRTEISPEFNFVANLCAHIAHRLAQPASADKEAKALAFIHWSQRRDDSRQMMDGKTKETLWSMLSTDERNGWRAVVAAVKGAGDE